LQKRSFPKAIAHWQVVCSIRHFTKFVPTNLLFWQFWKSISSAAELSCDVMGLRIFVLKAAIIFYCRDIMRRVNICNIAKMKTQCLLGKTGGFNLMIDNIFHYSAWLTS